MKKKRILKECRHKSYDWASKPVILDSMFREYDLRNPISDVEKGGKPVLAGVNADGFRALGQAYGTYAQKVLKQEKIVVANDYRYYARGMAYAFITGALSTGVDVIDIGTQITPALYFAQYHFDLAGAAMITSSHNDNGWSGIKLAKGLSQTFEPEDIMAYKKLVYSEDYLEGQGSYERAYGFKDTYVADLYKTVKGSMGKRKLKIVISGGNGGGGTYLEELFSKLGFDVVPVMNELDWDFPNGNPNPEHIAFLNGMKDKVREEKADFGVGVDGDGDRIGVVNEKGEEVFADRVGLMIARYLLEDSKEKGRNFVIDVKATGAYAIDPILKKYDTGVIFVKTGHSYVKAGTQQHDSLAGFEKSGHFFLRGKYGRGYDDSLISAAWVAMLLSGSKKALSELIDEQPKSYQSLTLEPSVTDDVVKYEIMEKILKHFQDLHKKGEKFAGLGIEELITVNGVRFILEGGAWGLVRASSNQPNMVITAESFRTRREMYDIIEAIQEVLAGYDDIGEYDQAMPPYEGED